MFRVELKVQDEHDPLRWDIEQWYVGSSDKVYPSIVAKLCGVMDDFLDEYTWKPELNPTFVEWYGRFVAALKDGECEKAVDIFEERIKVDFEISEEREFPDSRIMDSINLCIRDHDNLREKGPSYFTEA